MIHIKMGKDIGEMSTEEIEELVLRMPEDEREGFFSCLMRNRGDRKWCEERGIDYYDVDMNMAIRDTYEEMFVVAEDLR